MKRFWVFIPIIFIAFFALAPLISRAVTVGPVKLEYTVDPGKTLKGQLFLQNEGAEPQTFYPSFEKFTEDSNGNRNYTKETSDLATWFRMVKSVTLAGGEGKQIPFTIEVPKNAPPGGHFAVIWWGSAPPGGSASQVSIVTRAGILVYLTVTGDAKEEGAIAGFSPTHRFFTATNLDFSLTFKNSGNTYLKPSGMLQLKNIFGGVSAETSINEFGSNVFPGTTRNFNIPLNPSGFFFGLYHAVASVTYGEINPKTASEGAYVIIAPWGTLIGFLVLVFLIFFGIPRGIRKYNAWIVSKARK